MSLALVFYTQSRTKDVVPTSTIPTEAQCGDVTRVRCNGRSYKAKVLHIGAKELCELKAGSVTSEGNLVEDEFDITSPLEDDDGDGSSEAGPSHAEKELVTRAIKIEDMTAVAIEKIRALDAKAAALDQRMDRMEQMMRELLRRVPPTQTQGEIVYSYASAKSVAELRQLKGLNMSHFVLALEMEVYQDDTSELELVVDSRIRTKDRVLFIQQVLFPFE